jgi:hypothetical protein
MKLSRQNHADSETGDPEVRRLLACLQPLVERPYAIEDPLRARSHPSPAVERSRGRGQCNNSLYGANFITVSMRRGANLI